jgi:peptide/nickel transport system permease protein
MQAYFIRRVLLLIPTLLILTLVLFLLLRMIPGTVVDIMLVEQSGSYTQSRQELEHALGLDTPAHVQYVRWLGDILRGNFGVSLWSKTTLFEEMGARLPVSIELSAMSMIISLSLSIPVGIYAAIRQDTIGDYIMRTVSILALATPGFWLATMVLVYPSIWWGWMPSVEYVAFIDNPLRNLGLFLLPAFIMGLVGSGGTMRITRTMMLEVLRQDYIRTAWSKGLRERVVVLRHAVRNTLIPVVTIIGGMIPALLSGSVIMEQIFNLPGMGRYLLTAVQNRDYPIVSGINLIIASLVMVMVLITDLAYAYVDPRIRYR